MEHSLSIFEDEQTTVLNLWCIFVVLHLWCGASLMNYVLVAIFLWCTVSSVRCIFGVMYMHFWYAMHRHLWWCLVGAITIVQCIFGALFLVLGCYGVASLVLFIVSYIAQACYRSGASTLFTV